MMVATPQNSVLHRTTEWIIEQTEWLCRIRFRPYQRDLARRIVASVLLNEGRTFTVEWARQIGKTEGGQALILGMMVFLPMLALDARYTREFPILAAYANGFLVGFVAPKLQTARIPFKRLRRLVHSRHSSNALLEMGLRVVTSSSEELTLSNGSSAMALSGAEGAFQEGHTQHFLWFEETQKIRQYQIRKQFEPMLAATNGTRVQVGTGGTVRGAFFEDIETNKRLHPEDHSAITWKQAIEIMRREAPDDPWTDRYEAHVLRTIEKLAAGEQSETFRLNYLLEWILKAYQLVTAETWAKLRGDGKDGRPRFARSEHSADAVRRVFGLDLAKAQDSTVCTSGDLFQDHARLVDWLELQGTDYVDQVDAIVPWANARGYGDLKYDARMTVDSTGVGDPVTDMIKRRLRGINGYTYTLQSKDALYKLWTGRLPKARGGCQVFYPDCPPTDREFRFFELQFLNCVVETKGNCIAYHHPEAEDSDEEADLLHDDYVDSAFNVLHAAEQPTGTFMAVSRRPSGPPLSSGDPVPQALEVEERDRKLREQMAQAIRKQLREAVKL